MAEETFWNMAAGPLNTADDKLLRALYAPLNPETVTPFLERLEYKVLDRGFVRLVDHMGEDASVVRAARVSYGAGSKGAEQDAKLIHYLMKHRHTSPFEHVTLTFHVKCPIFVARQWMRHRTGSFNEISARYTEMKNEFYTPLTQEIRCQSKTHKQGSAGQLSYSKACEVQDALERHYENSHALYEELLDFGVAREQARMVLPVALYTEFYWTVNLHNLFHFLSLRLDSHAQYEIRVFAHALLDIAQEVAPVSAAAFLQCADASIRYLVYTENKAPDTTDEGTVHGE